MPNQREWFLVKWIVANSKDIVVDENQLLARSNFIQRVTGAQVSEWKLIFANAFMCCISDDNIDGTFITSHIGDVINLCTMELVYNSEFIVANTCIWCHMEDKKLLKKLWSRNRNTQLWFAKQELSLCNNDILRQSNTISNIGQFGFQTSYSERKLFMNRKKGFMNSLELSFNRVSPIML